MNGKYIGYINTLQVKDKNAIIITRKSNNSAVDVERGIKMYK